MSFARVDGEWKKIDYASVKVNDEWVPCEGVFKKHNGGWLEVIGPNTTRFINTTARSSSSIYEMMGEPQEVGRYVFINRAEINGNLADYALRTGVFPEGSELTVINESEINGAGGAPSGGAGGHALLLDMDVTLINDGIMRGGGGAGGQGGRGGGGRATSSRRYYYPDFHLDELGPNSSYYYITGDDRGDGRAFAMWDGKNYIGMPGDSAISTQGPITGVSRAGTVNITGYGFQAANGRYGVRAYWTVTSISDSSGGAGGAGGAGEGGNQERDEGSNGTAGSGSAGRGGVGGAGGYYNSPGESGGVGADGSRTSGSAGEAGGAAGQIVNKGSFKVNGE